MLRNYWNRFKTFHWHKFQAQKGQSIVIIAFAFLGLIAMLGLALDLGLVYIERVRVSRTTDAATLAAVVELPFEGETIARAIEYIELNGYQPGVDTEIRVRGCVADPTSGAAAAPLANIGEGGIYDPNAIVSISPANNTAGYTYIPVAGGDTPRAIFVIDTMAYQPVERDNTNAVTSRNKDNCTGTTGDSSALYGTATKVRVSGQVLVDMNFMQFFGFDEMPVADQATAENVTNLDVVVVFDVSGSMEFETNCYGCWVKDNSLDDNPAEVMDNPYPLNGDFNPLDYRGSDTFWYDDSGTLEASNNICGLAPNSYESDGDHYLVHEAELYSADVPLHGWEFDKRASGQGFWVIQRRNRGSNDSYIRPHPFPTYGQSSMSYYPRLQGGSYDAQCFAGAFLSGKCWETRADDLGEAAPSNVPWVEYDFTPDWDGYTHIWIRAIGGSDHAYEWYGYDAERLVRMRESIYWQVDGEPVRGGEFNNIQTGGWDGPNSDNDWRWVKLGDVYTGDAGTRHVLKLYQGSAGFNVDKIIFTDNNDGAANSAVSNGGSEYGTYIGNDLEDVLTMNNGRGPDATNGSATREACNKCNPAFGQIVDPAECTCMAGPFDTGLGTGLGCTEVLTTTNMLQNDLFNGQYDPIRSAQEAVKNFASRLDPKFDQIGFVAYSSNMVSPRVKLQCLRYAQSAYGDQSLCYDSSSPISFTNVIWAVENHKPGGSTNIAGGMREGLEELGVVVNGYTDENFSNFQSSCSEISNWGGYKNGDGQPCDRRGAARRVLILMTDGSPNQSVSCPGSYEWKGEGSGDSYDCAMYFSYVAADNNVTVYTIGIGSGAKVDLMTAMATGTDPFTGDYYFEGRGGRYYPAAQPSDLDAIFEDILSNIFVRIVG